MCDLDKHLQKVTDEEVAEKRREIEGFFVISEDDAADPLAQKTDRRTAQLVGKSGGCSGETCG